MGNTFMNLAVTLNLWFLLTLMLIAFIAGMVIAFRMSTNHSYYRDIR